MNHDLYKTIQIIIVLLMIAIDLKYFVSMDEMVKGF